jgi:hypothetical protein
VRGQVHLAEAALADELAQRVVPHRFEVGCSEFTVAPSASGRRRIARRRRGGAYSSSCLYELASCCPPVSANVHLRQKFCILWQTDTRVAAEARGAYQRAGAATLASTYLLPLGLDLSLGSEVRLHGLRRSVVEKTTSAASSMGAGELSGQERRGSVKQLTVAAARASFRVVGGEGCCKNMRACRHGRQIYDKTSVVCEIAMRRPRSPERPSGWRPVIPASIARNRGLGKGCTTEAWYPACN